MILALRRAFLFTVFGIGRLFLVLLHRLAIELRIVALHPQQEDAALFTATRGAVFLQVIAEIQRLVMRLALLQLRQRNLLLEAFGQIVHAEGADELRFVEVTFRLRDQVLQLRGQDAADFHFHAGQVAHHHRDFLFPAQGQQRALAEDIQLRRERRHLHHVLHPLGERIAAERLHAALDLHVEVAADRRVVFEDVVLVVFAFAGDEFEIDARRFLQQFIGDFRRIAPGIRAAALFLLRFRVVHRQQPCTGGALDVLFERAGRERGGDDLFRLVFGRQRHVDRKLVHRQAGQPGYAHQLRNRIVERRAGARRHQALLDFQFDAAVFLRRGEIFGMDIGV